MREYELRVRAFKRVESREWERIRLLSWYVISPYQKEGSSSQPIDLFALPDIDPSVEERELMKEQDYNKSKDRIKQYEALGLLRPN